MLQQPLPIEHPKELVQNHRILSGECDGMHGPSLVVVVVGHLASHLESSAFTYIVSLGVQDFTSNIWTFRD